MPIAFRSLLVLTLAGVLAAGVALTFSPAAGAAARYRDAEAQAYHTASDVWQLTGKFPLEQVTYTIHCSHTSQARTAHCSIAWKTSDGASWRATGTLRNVHPLGQQPRSRIPYRFRVLRRCQPGTCSPARKRMVWKGYDYNTVA